MSPTNAAAGLLSTLLFVFAGNAHAQVELSCFSVDIPPRIDGKTDDKAWLSSQPVAIADSVAPLSHTLHCVYDNERIYVQVSYPDTTVNLEHQTWIWTPGKPHPNISGKREDTLVLKWNMQAVSTDLSLHADYPYTADLWYWKAHRTEGGYADDMLQKYTNQALPRSKRLISRFGKRFYLQTQGDEGEAAYQPRILLKNFGNLEQPGYSHQLPTASRADIRAKGRWQSGKWNIEFSRLLNTGHKDDVQLNPRNRYHFGVSRYAIAGESYNASLQIPEFGEGDVTQLISLVFQQPAASQ